MNKKFKLTSTRHALNPNLFQIKALRNFGNVKAGDLGGYIEKEINLSHEGDAWVYDNAKVYGNARVRDNGIVTNSAEVYDDAWVAFDAVVSHNAKIYGSSHVTENGRVTGNAEVFDTARVSGDAKVSGGAKIYHNAKISGNAKVLDYAEVYGLAWVTGCARIKDAAKVYGNAQVYGTAHVCEDAVICQSFHVGLGVVKKDLTKDLVANIKAQTTLYPTGGKVLCYKYVNNDLTSLYDKNFVYKVGEWVEEPNACLDPTKSCSAGLHFSHASYWDHGLRETAILIVCEVMLEDIICVQEGKIRAKKCFVIGT